MLHHNHLFYIPIKQQTDFYSMDLANLDIRVKDVVTIPLIGKVDLELMDFIRYIAYTSI